MGRKPPTSKGGVNHEVHETNEPKPKLYESR